jgi:hypothetical protein
MIWSMIVYFFAVIGVVALIYYCIGWAFIHEDELPCFGMKDLMVEIDDEHQDKPGMPAFESSHETQEFYEQMKAHKNAHNK